MLRIRPEQFAALEGSAVDRYAHKLAIYLRGASPNLLRDLSDDAAIEHVRDAVVRARTRRVTDPLATAAFVELALRAGADFDDDPAVRDQLVAAPNATPLILLERLRSRE